MEILLALLGALLLYAGGELLVKGAVNLSRLYELSPMVIGLTVVAFGTSTPELASSLIAVWREAPAIAVGNVVGSNIANIGLILGCAACLFPIAARSEFLRRETPILVAVTALVPLVLADHTVSRLEGIMLSALVIPYLWLLLRQKGSADVEKEFEQEYGDATGSPMQAVGFVVGGALLLILGATALVEGAVALARQWGISERVIGITVVAFGTSLPELATAIVAALRREADIALGNVVGSNVFNILAVLGLTAASRPIAVDPGSMTIDVGVMMALSLALVPMLLTKQRISRMEGAVLISAYATYVWFLFSTQ